MTKFVNSLLVLLLFSTAGLHAQGQAEMADGLRTEGKIYVVVIIVLLVLAGLIFYLFLMDKKVKKLEKLVSERKKQTNSI